MQQTTEKKEANPLMKNDKGFSLVEVVASLVLITIVLMSFAQIFVQSNKVAATNNEKLTTINLADAVLAKIKSQPLKNPAVTPPTLNDYFNDTTVVDKKIKNPPTEIELNGNIYTITYNPSQSNATHTNAFNSESTLKLVKVVVTVTSPNGKTKGSSEGYVSIE